jgi:hypothetical protein
LDDGIALDEQPVVAVAVAAPPAAIDDWQLRHRSRQLGRALRREPARGQAQMSDFQPSMRRLDPPHQLFEDFAPHAAALPFDGAAGAAPMRVSPRQPAAAQFITWIVAVVGATVLGCGLGVISWSLSHSQFEFWNLAIGLTLTGQGLLIFGLVLLVMRLWRNSRYASAKLHEVHTDLDQLQRTATALAAMRSGGAPTFYAELVRGASPQMLLSNLKGQIDQLAGRLNV